MENLLRGLALRGDLIFQVTLFVCVVLVVLAFTNMTVSWRDVRRRTVAVLDGHVNSPQSPGNLIEARTKNSVLAGLMPTDEARKSELSRFMNSSGYYGANVVVVFQLIRIISAILFGVLTASTYGQLYPEQPFICTIAASLVMILLGYMIPRIFVSMGRDKLLEEHRQGFPDFMDLLVICVEAGIGIDSAMERVGRDLARSYPSLSRNIGFMSLELRAGRSTREALGNLGWRLGIDEARSFTTLIQQSEELGTSLVQSLRVYADDMRAKRLTRAEEKANALPVKLVLPLALFIFPVILGITLMPVAIKVYQALKI